MNTLKVVLACGLVSFLAQNAHAQWLDFTDETATRFTITNAPLTDAEEKDLAVGDFNKDGWDDVVVVRKVPFSNIGPRRDLLFLNESGVLVDRSSEFGFGSALTDARDVFVCDVNNDTWPDIAIATTFQDIPRLYMNRGADMLGSWLGFREESNRVDVMVEPDRKFCALWGGDINGDGFVDLYYSNYNGGQDVLLVNMGAANPGQFEDHSFGRLGDNANVAFGTSCEIHDVDQDGDFDIVKLSTLFDQAPFNNGVFLLFNDGLGVFSRIPFFEYSSDDPYMFTMVDLNNDGMLDMYIEEDSQDQVLLTTAITPDVGVTYAASEPNSTRTSGFGGNTKFADLDNDGDQDIGIAPIDVDIQNCGGQGVFCLLRNDGAGALDDPYPIDTNLQIQPHDFVFIDINRDGCLDIVMGLCDGYAVFMQDNCSPPCPCDWDAGGILNSDDFFAFLDDFFTGSADFDDNGLTNSDDFFGFLDCFFAGC